MLSGYFCAAVLFAFSATLCNALIIPPSEGSLVSTPASLINISLPVDTQSTASSNDIRIDCKGAQYGFKVKYGSCLDAFSTFTDGGTSNPVRVGRRNTGSGYTQNLPWKWVSGDGVCTFDVIIRGRNPSDITSGGELARSAWKLMNECVRDQGGQGGIVTGIGRAGSIAITVRPYDPSKVRCGSTPQEYGETICEPALDMLPAEVTPIRRWGARGSRDIDYPLPFSWAADPPYQNCRVYVLGTSIERPARDEMSFYDMWEAAAMIQGMCVRYGKPGIVTKLGVRKLLWVAIDDGSKPPYLEGKDIHAVFNETALAIE